VLEDSDRRESAGGGGVLSRISVTRQEDRKGHEIDRGGGRDGWVARREGWRDAAIEVGICDTHGFSFLPAR